MYIYLYVGCERCNCDPGTGAVFETQRPDVGGSAVQLIPGRGRSLPGSALYSEALLYSLLGLCIIVLMFTLTVAVLLLLQRARQQQQLNKHGQSSEGDSYYIFNSSPKILNVFDLTIVSSIISYYGSVNNLSLTHTHQIK